MRGGRECLVTNTDVVVGDVLVLDTGDKLVADGVAVEAFGLVIDEARPRRRRARRARGRLRSSDGGALLPPGVPAPR